MIIGKQAHGLGYLAIFHLLYGDYYICILMKWLSVTMLFLWISCCPVHGENLPSGVYPSGKVSGDGKGRPKSIISGTTPTLDYLEVHMENLPVGNGKKLPMTKHSNYEEMIIVREGVLDVVINGNRWSVPAGGIILICPGDSHLITNNSQAPAAYYLFHWKTVKVPPPNRQNRQSSVYQWNDLTFVPSENGGRRNVLQRPTADLNELEIHVTTLKEGLTSHKAHTHADDEFILVKTGRVEETIGGIPYKAGTGDLIFLAGNDLHGIRNDGSGICEYYAIRLK